MNELNYIVSPAAGRSAIHFICVVFVFLFIAAAAPSAFGQDADDVDSALPPLKFMSDGERKQLDAESDIKDRTRLALDLMDRRLTNAETNFAKADYEQMYKELGSFNALMDDTLQFLDIQYRRSKRGKVLDNYKRFEIGLRRLAPRIQLLRRELPIEYDPYVKNLVRYVRDAREKAVEPFFGNQFADTAEAGVH
jgi:hypothetical protein